MSEITQSEMADYFDALHARLDTAQQRLANRDHLVLSDVEELQEKILRVWAITYVQDDMDALRAELAEARHRIDEVEAQSLGFYVDREHLADELAEARRRIAELEADNAE